MDKRSLSGPQFMVSQSQTQLKTNTFMSLFTFLAHKNSTGICVLVISCDLANLSITSSIGFLWGFLVYLLGFSCIESCHL